MELSSYLSLWGVGPHCSKNDEEGWSDEEARSSHGEEKGGKKFQMHTYEVSAASSSGPPDPAALVNYHLPFMCCIILKGIRRQVADLNFVEMGLEIIKLHPI